MLLTVLHCCYVRCMSTESLLLKMVFVVRPEVFMAGRTKLQSFSLKMHVPLYTGNVFTKVYGAVFNSDHKTPSPSSRDCVWLNLGPILRLTNDRTKAGPNSHYAFKHLCVPSTLWRCLPNRRCVIIAVWATCRVTCCLWSSEFSDQKFC